MKLQKRNPTVWDLYLKLLAAEDVLQTGTAWHGPTWSTATDGEKDEARRRCEALAKKIRAALALVPRSEVEGWDKFGELQRRGLV